MVFWIVLWTFCRTNFKCRASGRSTFNIEIHVVHDMMHELVAQVEIFGLTDWNTDLDCKALVIDLLNYGPVSLIS